jgi:nitroreductase
MDALVSMKKTCSSHSYLDKKVSQKHISKLLDAAHFAPSSGNIQNWRFIVVQNPDTKEKLARCCLNQLWMQEAPVLIVITSDNSNLKAHYPEGWKKYCGQNCAAAAQNIILEANNLGLASCWIRSFSETKLKSTLKIPDNVSVEAIISIGYSKDTPKEPRKKIENLTFFEAYGNRKKDRDILPLSKHFKR